MITVDNSSTALISNFNRSPCCEIINNQVEPRNLPADARGYWNSAMANNMKQDLITAKLMALPLINPSNNMFEKIAGSAHNEFWIREFDQFFELAKAATADQGKVAIILDRTSNCTSWIKKFAQHADQNGIERNLIKVCFRSRQPEVDNLNQTIKALQLTGPVDQGKIYIFRHSPPKWLFANNHSVKVIATNNIYPNASRITSEWMKSHPLNIYLGRLRPVLTNGRRKKIESL